MDFARITPEFAVAPQILPRDAEELREAGFTDVVCNRPDEEVQDEVASQAVRAAVEGAGLRFHDNPVRNGAMSEQNIEEQRRVLAEAEGPVLAYCRSGTRSAVVWALGREDLSVDQILSATGEAGYALDGLRPQLEARRNR
ncbi:TIGR01244 family sulfur transferase [Roseitranquillus sediminis]|uniref:TIGR01244 family sulfur transferase n=1 Tax=Roseitranquillus sediminis TaxID=2809051 RepID=UPI001D0C9548|nr:TIGR01244 family sulfur transferase [Roseitranquillus sediminis]MBM9595682.1 TIGR01244 family phosphatase [Roseitranquillus sediminis]